MDAMEQIIMDILAELRSGRAVDDRVLLKLSHAAARREHADKRMFAKRRLLPFYQGGVGRYARTRRALARRAAHEASSQRLGCRNDHGHHQAMALWWRLPLLPQ